MKKLFKLISFLFIIFCIYNASINQNDFFQIIFDTLFVWLYKVFPSIFFFSLISSFIICFNILKPFNPILNKLFKFESDKSSLIFVLSLLLGNPSTTNLLINELSKKTITKKDAETLLKTASFMNPLFIISFFTPNLKYAFIIIFVHIGTNIFLLFIINKTNNTSFISSNNNSISNLSSFLDSINSIISILLSILSIMICVNILKFNIVFTLKLLTLNTPLFLLIISLLEISSGLLYLFSLKLGLFTIPIFTFMISFLGLSIHIQVYSIIKGKIKYSIFLKYRVLQALISSIIVLIIIYLI